ncbi:MAG: sensor histidine kinase [Flavisolibacter sp.]
MITPAEKNELLLKTHQLLLEAILHKGADPESDLRRIMAPHIKGTGTAKHEVYNNVEEYISKIFKIEIGQMPTGIEVVYQKPNIIFSDSMAVVFGLSEVKFMLNGTTNVMHKRRTVIFEWTANNWRAIHLHASEPSYQILEGESWPIEALKARNEELKKLVDEKTFKLTRSIEELKLAQAQLIQSEKMASLGELTAGIAHEIQNPLNFVNNFSEVNKELLVEMNEEIEKGNLNEIKAIAKDVIENEQKINHHGKRADAIVKGMLQHSRMSTGQKEPTNINKLADEYLRLTYHGQRAKDKSFDVTMKTDFDETIENINIIPQDIGRVILNLITNAFYAVTEKEKQTGEGYEPTVSLSTKKINGKVEISVKDNGSGIPQKVLDKIFQPFFTTKPTGQGTGLGLSLSYDIIKAHGGEIKVETKEGEGAEFIILLPIKQTDYYSLLNKRHVQTTFAQQH